jgi:hypothetical protein
LFKTGTEATRRMLDYGTSLIVLTDVLRYLRSVIKWNFKQQSAHHPCLQHPNGDNVPRFDFFASFESSTKTRERH